jgi:hypothetical protein
MQQPTSRVASGDLLSQLGLIMKNGMFCTAEERHQHLLEVFQAAESAQLNALLSVPDDLALAAEFVHAVLDELDERRCAAAAEVHEVLGRAAPIIVGWPE